MNITRVNESNHTNETFLYALDRVPFNQVLQSEDLKVIVRERISFQVSRN